METCFYNGDNLPKENVRISPDDRGFLFADGIYEVVRWYGRSFYDMDNHMTRLMRSLREVNIKWDDVMRFPAIAEQLISDNKLYHQNAMVYLQVTRGAARRTHNYPVPDVQPTVYATAYGFNPDIESQQKGVKIILSEDIRWTRCDIKSVSLLANTMCFQQAFSKGYKECAFVRDGMITEASHSNIFFVREEKLFTHPESNHILSGITRKNIIRLAKDSGMQIMETPVNERDIKFIRECFLASTSAEITPVTEIGDMTVGNGMPGTITGMLLEKFQAETAAIK